MGRAALLGEASGTLVKDGLLDTLALGEGDKGILGVSTLANDEGILETGGKDGTVGILDLNNVEGARVTLTVDEDTDTASVTTLGDHNSVASLELEAVNNLASAEVKLDGIVGLDKGIRVTEGAAVVGDEVWDTLAGGTLLADTGKLVTSLSGTNLVEDETSLGVVEKTHALGSALTSLDLDDVHETGGEVELGTDLAIDLNSLLHDNHQGLLAGQGILQAVAEDDADGQALAGLVGASRGLGGKDAAHLVEHPMLGGIQALHVLNGSSGHFDLALFWRVVRH